MGTAQADVSNLKLTWDGLRRGVAQIAKDRGWHHGVPMMSIFDTKRRIVLAKGCPLADKHGHDTPISMGGEQQLHVCSDEDVNEEQDVPRVVNIWRTAPKIIAVAKYSKGAVVQKFDRAQENLNFLINNMICQAGAVDSDAELEAMCSLLKRINDNQRDSYILGGAFPETSKRSGVTYILRKGRPTIAMRGQNFLAALCSHPLAYYEGTWTGAYPPSDEVLANLLSIRADEAKFWARSYQHALDDPLAGI